MHRWRAARFSRREKKTRWFADWMVSSQPDYFLSVGYVFFTWPFCEATVSDISLLCGKIYLSTHFCFFFLAKRSLPNHPISQPACFSNHKKTIPTNNPSNCIHHQSVLFLWNKLVPRTSIAFKKKPCSHASTPVVQSPSKKGVLAPSVPHSLSLSAMVTNFGLERPRVELSMLELQF